VSRVALSVVTVEEVSFGLAWRPNARVADWFGCFLEAHCEVLPVSLEIVRRAGDLRGALMSKGIPRTQADMLIAATAQVHHLTVVTRNVRDFERTTVALLNPFS
jgi:predicted nucleic acid-binding protein